MEIKHCVTTCSCKRSYSSNSFKPDFNVCLCVLIERLKLICHGTRLVIGTFIFLIVVKFGYDPPKGFM